MGDASLGMQIGRIVVMMLWFLIGASVFSFVNVLIYRLPKKLQVMKGKSMCTSCSHELSARDIIPIFSWIFLGGRCRYCKEKINIRYTLIELLGGLTMVFLIWFYGMNVYAVTVFAFFALLTAVTFIDADTMEIPFVLNIAIFVVGVISIFTMKDVTILDRIIGFFSVSLPLFLIVLVIPEGFGGGDIKLMAAAGFLLGWKKNLIGFFIGLILGALYGVILLIRRKKGKKEHFAFGPFLSVGLALSTICGIEIISAYINLIKSMLPPVY